MQAQRHYGGKTITLMEKQSILVSENTFYIKYIVNLGNICVQPKITL